MGSTAPDDLEGLVGTSYVERLASRLGSTATARAAFGDAVKNGDVTVIPVARAAFGFGGGAGPAGHSAGAGTGEGGGGGVVVRPVGFIEVRPDGARFRRIHNPFAIALGLAALTVPLSRALKRITRRRPTEPGPPTVVHLAHRPGAWRPGPRRHAERRRQAPRLAGRRS